MCAVNYKFTSKTGGFESYDSDQLLCGGMVEVNFKILKLQVTFTKRLSFKTTFKGHSIVMYSNHASTKEVINTQKQCQIWIYLKTTCCVQLNIVL